MNKKVLIIAYNYPPISNGGVQRPYAFSKYLSLNGYETIIITTNIQGEIKNENNVYRFNSFDESMYNKSLLRKIFIMTVKIFRKMLFGIGFINIYGYRWYKIVINNIEQIIETHHPDIVFATYPGYANLAIGAYVKEKHAIPLISDFRDGFVFESIAYLNPIQKYIAKRMEKNIIDISDCIVTVAPQISDYFINNYGIKKVKTIYNGFDTDDLIVDINKSINDKNEKYKMMHFGGINSSSRNRRAEDLFKALKRLKINNIINKDNYELSLYGRITKKELLLIDKYNLSDIIKYYGYVDRKKGFQIIKSTYDSLLFIGCKDQTGIVSSKLLEYIFLDKPILGICKGNEAGNVINCTKTGIVVDFDEEEIIKGINAIMYSYTFNPNWSEIEKYSRKHQIKDIIEIIDVIS